MTLPKNTEIRVWDSTSEIRYLVIPERPAGTEGWSEDKLAALVTRDSMIGTGLAEAPVVNPPSGGVGPDGLRPLASDVAGPHDRGGEGSDPVAPSGTP